MHHGPERLCAKRIGDSLDGNPVAAIGELILIGNPNGGPYVEQIEGDPACFRVTCGQDCRTIIGMVDIYADVNENIIGECPSSLRIDPTSPYGYDAGCQVYEA